MSPKRLGSILAALTIVAGLTFNATGFVATLLVFTLSFLGRFRTSTAQKMLFATVVFFACFAAQPFWLPINDILQTAATVSAKGLLQILGAPVWHEGTTIYGLATTIHVTQACVGIDVIATTAALAFLLGHLFAPLQRQGAMWASMLALSIILNWVRIAVVALISHYFADISFNEIHDVAGISLALLTYTCMGAILWLGSQDRSVKRDCNG